MKTQQIIGLVLFATLVVSACSDNKSATTQSDIAKSATETLNTALAKNTNQVQGATFFVGDLSETFNAGGYTYVNVTTADGAVWAAGPVTAVKKGDKISFASKMLMRNFQSKALKREFKEIYFVKVFTVNGERMDAAPMAAMDSKSVAGELKKNPHNSAATTDKVNSAMVLKPMKKANNGQSIADIIANVDSFRDKTVIVRGQVSKITMNILGTNWLHIRDHSSQQDLIVTTSGKTNMGDIILVKGRLALDKDFGKGFVMDRVVDNATIKVE